MSACYSCKQTLNKMNRSFEHIIPNAIGGVLKSARLLCRQCNAAYGMTIDAALAKDFENLVAFLNVKRERSKQYIIKNTVAPNGDRYHLENGRNPVPVKPTVRFEDGRLFIAGRDRKHVMQIASGLKRKFPDIDLEGIENNFRDDDILLDHELTINFSVGSDLFMRSVAKIAVNYYLMKARGSHYLEKIIDIINGIQTNNHDIHYYPLPDHLWRNDEVSHMIIVKGDAGRERLYAHVVLFNTYSLVVNLCDAYSGENVEYCYRYDIIKGMQIDDSLTIDYDRSEFLNRLNYHLEDWNMERIQSVQNNLGRILHLAEKYQSKLALEELISRTFDKAIAPYPTGTVVTEEIANDVHDKVMKKVMEFLGRR